MPPISSVDLVTASPDNYEGLISEFIDAYVLPNIAPPERLVGWMQAVLDYHAGADPICIVRGPRKGELARRGGLRTVHSDNSPGIWCFIRSLDGRFDPAGLAEAIDGGQVPVLAALRGRANRDWEWNYSHKALSKKDSGLIWDLQLKHCHILPVKKGPGVGDRQRAIRNICPANHFAFPNGWGGRHFVTERVGWSESAPDDLGESPLVIAWVRSRIEQRLGEAHARLYQRFIAAAGADARRDQLIDRRIRIERVREGVARRSGERARPLGVRRPVAVASASVAASRGSAPTSAVARRWTLNVKHGYYVKTGETASVIDLYLSLKDPRGAVIPVGRFILDLPALVALDVVTARQGVYDIKVVYRGGRFYLGVRSSPQVPLADYAIA